MENDGGGRELCGEFTFRTNDVSTKDKANENFSEIENICIVVSGGEFSQTLPDFHALLVAFSHGIWKNPLENVHVNLHSSVVDCIVTFTEHLKVK